MNIIFAGTPEFAAAHLQALLNSDHTLVAVYTQPDRPAGRGRHATASAVKQLALQHDIPVFQPTTLRDENAQAALRALDADIMVVVAYGLLLPKAVLETPRLGCINVHASLLPKWRGAAPIQHAILAGDYETGVSIMQMDEGLDTGDVLITARLPIEDDDSSASLHEKLATLGAQTLVQALTGIENGDITAEKQNNDLASYASKLTKQAGRIDWQQSAVQIHRQVRGLNPWPVAFSVIDGETLRIWQASVIEATHDAEPGTIINISKDGIDVQTQQNILRLSKVQRPNKKAMDAFSASQAQDSPLKVGQCFQGNSA